MRKFICTDIDNMQFGRKINKNTYEFKEFNRNSYNFVDEVEKLGEKKFKKLYWRDKRYWIRETINLQNYTSKTIKNILSAYYSNFKGLTNWIIAECIFEQENELY